MEHAPVALQIRGSNLVQKSCQVIALVPISFVDVRV